MKEFSHDPGLCCWSVGLAWVGARGANFAQEISWILRNPYDALMDVDAITVKQRLLSCDDMQK